MTAVLIPQRRVWKRQPPGISRVDQSTPFCPRAGALVEVCGIPFDAYSGRAGTRNAPTSETSAAAAFGLGARFTGGTLAGHLYPDRATAITSATMAAVFVWESGGANNFPQLIGTSSQNNGLRLGATGVAGGDLALTKGGIGSVGSAVSVSSGVPYFVIASYDHATGDGYIKLFNLLTGAVSATSGNNTTAPSAGSGSFAVGIARTDFSGAWNGTIGLGYVSAAAMPAAVADAWIEAGPWALFAPRNEPAFLMAVAGGSTYNVSLSEPASASDAFAASAALAGALSEAASASDVVAAAAVYASTLSESASAADTVSGALMIGSALAEAATATDSVSSAATLPASLSEAASASDQFDGSIGANTYSASISESVSADDAWSSAAVLAAQLVGAVTAQDTASASAVFVSVLTEVATASDALSAVGVFAEAISEAASASDAWSEASFNTYEVALSEAVTAVDIWSSSGISGAPGVRGRSVAREVVRRLRMAGQSRGTRI